MKEEIMSDFQKIEESQPQKPEWLRDGEARLRDYETKDKLRELEEEEAKKSPYTKRGGFTQFADAELGNLARLTIENQTAAAIFLFLTRYMSNHNAVACSHSVLMQVTGKSRATVSKAVSVLKEKNYIGIKKLGTSQVFHLNANVVWHSYGKNVRFAELVAPILLDPLENPELTGEELQIETGKVNVLNPAPKTPKKKAGRHTGQAEMEL